MTFFTTPERLEIGDIPFPSPNPKPTRNEALQYYRLVAAYYKLDVRQYHRVERVTGSDGAFTVHTDRPLRPPRHLKARKLVISTGYYDLPNYLNIPGEDSQQGPPLLQRSPSLLRDWTSSSSAAKTPPPSPPLNSGVTAPVSPSSIADRKIHRHVKYWIKPDIENRIKNGEVKAFFNSNVIEITQDSIVVENPQGRQTPQERLRLRHDRLPPRL